MVLCHSNGAGAIVGRVDVVVVVEVCNGKVSVKSLYTCYYYIQKNGCSHISSSQRTRGFLRNTATCNINNIQKRDQLPTHITTPPTTESPAFMHNTTTNYIEGKIPTVMSCHNFRPTAVIMSHVMTQHRSSYTKS